VSKKLSLVIQEAVELIKPIYSNRCQTSNKFCRLSLLSLAALGVSLMPPAQAICRREVNVVMGIGISYD